MQAVNGSLKCPLIFSRIPAKFSPLDPYIKLFDCTISSAIAPASARPLPFRSQPLFYSNKPAYHLPDESNDYLGAFLRKIYSRVAAFPAYNR
jgi:hypothetical protein